MDCVTADVGVTVGELDGLRVMGCLDGHLVGSFDGDLEGAFDGLFVVCILGVQVGGLVKE